MAVLTALAIGSIIAATATKSVAAHKAGKEQARALTEQQQNAEFNAGQAQEQVYDASRRGVETANTYRRDVRGVQGTQRAGYGAQGVDVSMGSALAANASAAGLGESDIARIRRNAEREALGFKNEVVNYQAEARNARLSAKAARSNARWAIAGTVLGGVGDMTMLAQRQGWGASKPATASTGTRVSIGDPLPGNKGNA